MESRKEEAGRKNDGQIKGEDPIPVQNVKKEFHKELEIAMELAMQDDEGNAQEFEQPHSTSANENMDTTAELELYVHQCQERIEEFDKELKQRDSTITQLEETLNGILSIVKKAHEEGRLAEDYVEVLKTRVSSASKSLPSVYQVKHEDDDIISEEQDRSLTEISESPALHPFPDRSRKNIENGANEAYYKQCSHQCQHLEEINQIKEQVLESLEFLQVPADVFLKHRELGLSDNIRYLSSQAHLYKCASEEAVAQLQSTKEKSESIKSEVISKKEEICKLNAQIEDLNCELKLMKDRCNKLQQDSIDMIHQS
ncbi:tropomyosin-like [Hetaerina americana]|uniref:tropomyosin-like n=1 Tax=Hetaerina americana TaxID=62018 RepID=UPI003A7F164D